MDILKNDVDIANVIGGIIYQRGVSKRLGGSCICVHLDGTSDYDVEEIMGDPYISDGVKNYLKNNFLAGKPMDLAFVPLNDVESYLEMKKQIK